MVLGVRAMKLIGTWYLNLARRPDKATYTKAMLQV